MINPQFKLSDPKAQKPTAIRTFIYIDGERMTFRTQTKIRPVLFVPATKEENGKPAFSGAPTKDKKLIAKYSKGNPNLEAELKNIEVRLNNIKYFLISCCQALDLEDKKYDKDYLLARLNEKFNADKKTEEEIVIEEAKEIKPTLTEYIELYIKEITSGKRLTDKSERFRPGTIKNYKGFQTQFKEYQKKYRIQIDFDDVSMGFYDHFISFFNTKNYSPNTIGRHIKNLKTIIRAAREAGLTENTEVDKKKFKSIKVSTDEIYLNEKELDLLFKKDLSDNKDQEIARDIFLVGCYLAQRYSDYSRIKAHHLQETSQGRKVINLTQLKTGIKVSIPVRYELDFILSKYNYNLPKTHEQGLNKSIKDIGKLVEIDELVDIEMVRGGLKIKKTVPKYQLIKTHTARRSGATNMYLAGIPTLEIMKITGHTSEANLLKYIKASTEETANKLSLHPYFNSEMKAI